MLQALSENNHDEALINATRGQKIATLELIKETRKSITGTDYPFGHAKKKVSIGEYAFEDFPDPENPVEIYSAADALIDNVTRLRARLLGRLCLFAEQVESTLGFGPLLEPADGDDQTADLTKT